MKTIAIILVSLAVATSVLVRTQAAAEAGKSPACHSDANCPSDQFCSKGRCVPHKGPLPPAGR